MRSQMEAEFLVAHSGKASDGNKLAARNLVTWKLGDPPREGYYLVTVQTDEGPPFVRMERWDGARWATLGGYVTVRAWDWVPEAWRG